MSAITSKRCRQNESLLFAFDIILTMRFSFFSSTMANIVISLIILFVLVNLFIIRRVNPRVLQHLRQTRASVAEYRNLERRRKGVQIAFGLMYLAIALTLLLAAIWIGLWFADILPVPVITPLRHIITHTRQTELARLGRLVSPIPRSVAIELASVLPFGLGR